MPQIDLGTILFDALGALFVVFYIYLSWIAAREWAFTYWLTSYGKVTQAEVVARHGFGSAKGGGNHYVEFRFVVPSESSGAEYTISHTVSRRHFERLNEGSTVNVIYIPLNPYLVRLYGDDEDNTERDTSTIVAVLIPILFAFLLLVTLLVMPRYFLTAPRTKFVSRKPLKIE